MIQNQLFSQSLSTEHKDLWYLQIEGQFWESKSQMYNQVGTSFKKKASGTFLTFSVISPLTFEMQTDLCVVCMILSPGSVSATLPSRCLSTLIWSLKVTLLSGSHCPTLGSPSPVVGHFICLWLFALVMFSSCIWVIFWMPLLRKTRSGLL